MNDGILKASEDQMKTAICPKPSPGQCLLAEHEAQFPQPAHLSSHHSRGHCTQTHCFLQKTKLFPIPFLCLAHPLLFPCSRGTSTGKPDHPQRHVPHGSLTCCSQHPLTLLYMYLLNDYGFKSILPTILYVWGSYLFRLLLYLPLHMGGPFTFVK